MRNIISGQEGVNRVAKLNLCFTYKTFDDCSFNPYFSCMSFNAIMFGVIVVFISTLIRLFSVKQTTQLHFVYKH